MAGIAGIWIQANREGGLFSSPFRRGRAVGLSHGRSPATRIPMTMPQVCCLAIAFLSLLGDLKAADPTPAQQDITLAQRAIARDPEQFENYNRLAMALARRARETADTNFYEQADAALAESFRLAPDNFEGRKIEVWCLLGRHAFGKALPMAEALNKRAPDDIFVYGLLADAHIELGNYQQAEEAAQWMLDLRPGNVAGLTRGAYLREFFGDIEGALDFMDKAYQRTPPQQTEDRAWILTQMGHLYLASGKIDLAEQLLAQALALFPGYHYALANMGKVRRAQGRFDEAVELFERRYTAAPHPENMYDVAVVLSDAGRFREANEAFAKFEKLGRGEMENVDNCNRELIFYYADHAQNPAEALRVAQLEMKRRQDIHTRHAYAWALHRNAMDAEARRQLELILALGVRDAQILYHAGVIAGSLNDAETAKRWWNQSLQINPLSEVAKQVREGLAALPTGLRAESAGREAH